MRIQPQTGMILCQQKPAEKNCPYGQMSEMYIFRAGKHKEELKMKARFKNGRCTKYPGDRLWQVGISF